MLFFFNSFSHCSGVILVHSSNSLFHSLVTVVGFLAIHLLPRIFQRFSIRFRSGLRTLGWTFHYFNVFSFKELFYPFYCLMGVLSRMQIAGWLGDEHRKEVWSLQSGLSVQILLNMETDPYPVQHWTGEQFQLQCWTDSPLRLYALSCPLMHLSFMVDRPFWGTWMS